MDFCGNFLTLRKRGFFGWIFLGAPQERVFVGIFWVSAREGFCAHVVCVGNCVVCVLSVFVVGGWGCLCWYCFCGRQVGLFVLVVESC